MCTHPTFLHCQKLDFIPIVPLPPSFHTQNTKLGPGGYINGGGSSSNKNSNNYSNSSYTAAMAAAAAVATKPTQIGE
jgi:hypothetical protein